MGTAESAKGKGKPARSTTEWLRRAWLKALLLFLPMLLCGPAMADDYVELTLKDGRIVKGSPMGGKSALNNDPIIIKDQDTGKMLPPISKADVVDIRVVVIKVNCQVCKDKRTIPCPKCGGTGKAVCAYCERGMKPCPDCGTERQMTPPFLPNRLRFGNRHQVTVPVGKVFCPTCNWNPDNDGISKVLQGVTDVSIKTRTEDRGGSRWVPCTNPKCGGTGFIDCPRTGCSHGKVPCDKCFGKFMEGNDPCLLCGGRGRLPCPKCGTPTLPSGDPTSRTVTPAGPSPVPGSTDALALEQKRLELKKQINDLNAKMCVPQAMLNGVNDLLNNPNTDAAKKEALKTQKLRLESELNGYKQQVAILEAGLAGIEKALQGDAGK